MNKIIYVMLPAGFKSGGPELGHQLVSYFCELGYDARAAYIDVIENICPVHDAFKKYVKKWEKFEDIIDNENVVIIFPETYTRFAVKFTKAKKVIWWMSVDNYKTYSNFKSFAKATGFLRAMSWLIKGRIRNGNKGIKIADLHLYQSEYARLFLEDQGITNYLPLSDYINDIYFHKNISIKEDYVLYNPKKGYAFTKTIIESSQDLMWIPIENMTNEEVFQLLNQSKVYIDFGNHPGKDRFPREAAMSGCCILTGKQGAAGNAIDVPIFDEYKFEDNPKNIPLIISKIKECIQNYDERIMDFIQYKSKIINEKEIFKQEASKFLSYIEENF